MRDHAARIDALFAALDLTRLDMAGVRARLEAGDKVGAARALLAHHRTSGAARWIRADPSAHAPDARASAGEIAAAAEAARKDVLTFQGVTGRAPRLENGGLDWDHRGPRGDREWALFLNRHFGLLPLLRARQAGGSEAHAAALSALLVDWVTSRPVEDKPVERDISPAWQPMSSASRLLQVWPHVFHGLREDAAFTDEARLLMLASVPEQAAHVKKHHRKRHNHTIKEMSGLAHAAACWPEFKAAPEWMAYALSTLEGEMERQFYPDGVHQELSAHYHRSALQYYVWVKDFAAEAGFPVAASLVARIEAAADYLATSLSPTGHGPLNNNGDLDANADRLLELADRFGREDWRHVATQGRAGAAPPRTSAFLPWAGQAFLRSGWGARDLFAMVDVGPWGAAHQHNDKLNLVVSGHGRDLLVDGGRYRYEAADPFVAHLRGSAGHNVLLIDGQGQKPDARLAVAPLTDAWHENAHASVVHGRFDAGFEGVEGQASHERVVAMIDKSWLLVVDRVVTDRPRAVTALFRHAPDLDVRADREGTASVDAGRGNLRVTPVAWRPTVTLVRGRETPTPMGWHSPDYNDRRPATTAMLESRVAGTSILAHVLTLATGPVPPATARVIARSADAVTLDIRPAPGAPVSRVRVDFAHWAGAAKAGGVGFALDRGGRPLARFSKSPASESPR